MRRRALLVAPAALLALPALARPALAQQAQAARPVVVASFTILADMAREVGGERIALRTIAGPDADSHAFQPRPSDAALLRDATVILRNGLGFEPWLDRLLRAAGPRGAVVTVTEGLSPRTMQGHAHEHGGHQRGEGQRHAAPRSVPDPHGWQDLRLAPVYLRNIVAGLAAADPAGAETYRRNAEGYAARLEALDGWVRAEIATVPEPRRRVVTSHDAFGYFGAAYGVTFLAPQGVSTEAEPSAAQVGRLIRQLRTEGITAVFMENVANPATLERLAQEAGVRLRGRLYADALSAPDGPAPSYEAMFRHNVGLMVPAMRGA